MKPNRYEEREEEPAGKQTAMSSDIEEVRLAGLNRTLNSHNPAPNNQQQSEQQERQRFSNFPELAN